MRLSKSDLDFRGTNDRRLESQSSAQSNETEARTLTLSQASAIVDNALAYARANNLAPMTVAVLDARGSIVALKMEDGSGLMRPDIAVPDNDEATVLAGIASVTGLTGDPGQVTT